MSRYEDDRSYYERERGPQGRERERFVEDDRVYMSGGRGRESPPDRGYARRPPPPPSRGYDDDFIRERRHFEDDRYERRSGGGGGPGSDYDRRVVFDREREREREYQPEPAPRRPPVLTRRQSSLDTYDRRPLRGFDQREEYGPPARREDIYRDDFRAPAYTPIPLPRMEALPPPRRSEREREHYDDERIIDRDYHIDEGRRYPDIVHEREVIRTHDERDRSRESRGTRTHRSSKHSPPSSRSSSSSRSHGGTSVKSEYPKKGKTRIPARLVSTRAIIDLEYPFTVEGNTVIIQKALAQEHIDAVLKLSEEYKKTEVHIMDNKSHAGEIIEERIERREEVIISPPPPATIVIAPPPPPPAPVIIDATHGHHDYHHGHTSVDVVEETIIRESSPHHHHHHHHRPDEVVIARSRSRSRSRAGRDIRREIRALERELELSHRPKVIDVEDYDIVRTERMEDGQMVVYEERVERAHTHKPARIEKDKKGRISISLPMYQ